ncbi:hypothetical protein [Mycobacterium sp.]|uniref:hypothetical protein n=1 Tax=Mycobacterium sp. TaxID=1785 RepID=UPI003F96B8BF
MTSTTEITNLDNKLWDTIFALKDRAEAAHTAADEAEYESDQRRAQEWRAEADVFDAAAGALIEIAAQLCALPGLIADEFTEIANAAVAAWERGGQDF